MKGWKEIFIKDLKIIGRNRLLLTVLILYPFVFMAVIALTFSRTNQPIRLGLINYDEPSGSVLSGEEGTGDGIGESVWIQGEPYASAELIQRFFGETIEIKNFEEEAAATEALRKGRVDAILIIPAGFVHQLKMLNETATAHLILDQSNLVKAVATETNIRGALSVIDRAIAENKVRMVVEGLSVLIDGGDFFGHQVIGLRDVVQDIDAIIEVLHDQPDLTQKLLRARELASSVIQDIGEAADYLKATAMPLEVAVSGLAGRELSLKETMVPTLIGLSTLWTGILCASILMVMEEEEGMRRRLRLTRLRSTALVVSKSLVSLTIIFLQAMTMCVIVGLIFDIPASGILFSLPVIAVMSFSSIGIGIVIAAFTREVTSAIVISVLIALPIFFISGAVYPLSQMPVFMQILAKCFSFTWGIEALSGAMLRGDPALIIFKYSGVLLLFGLFFLAMGTVLNRRLG